MKKPSKYHWITFIALAIVCQLISSRIAESFGSHTIFRSDITKIDYLALANAPQSPLASIEAKVFEPVKGNGGFAKFVDYCLESDTSSVAQSRWSIYQPAFPNKQRAPLWLLYRNLLI